MRDAGKAISYLSYLKNSIASGACPGPAEGAHDTSPDPFVVWEGRLSPHPTPSVPSVPRSLGGNPSVYLIYLSGQLLSKILDSPQNIVIVVVVVVVIIVVVVVCSSSSSSSINRPNSSNKVLLVQSQK